MRIKMTESVCVFLLLLYYLFRIEFQCDDDASNGFSDKFGKKMYNTVTTTTTVTPMTKMFASTFFTILFLISRVVTTKLSKKKIQMKTVNRLSTLRVLLFC